MQVCTEKMKKKERAQNLNTVLKIKTCARMKSADVINIRLITACMSLRCGRRCSWRTDEKVYR